MAKEQVCDPALSCSRDHDSNFPIASVHGLHLRPESRTLVILHEAYFDGSGKVDAAAVSLAGLSSPEAAWAEFDAQWEAVLRKHESPCFHTADAMALQGTFAPERGWDAARVSHLIRDLIKVIADHMIRGAEARSCTVIRADYNAAKKDHPTLRPLAAICVNFCVGTMPFGPEGEYVLYFDRNEPFMHQINRVWLKLRKRREPGWPMRIRNIVPIDSGYYSIQAADLLAWGVNREHTRGDMPHLAIPAKWFTSWKLYDYDAIVERYANDKWS